MANPEDKKLSRKEIREPDAFQKATAQLGEKMFAHQKAVLGALAGLLGLVVLFAIGSQVSAGKKTDAGGALARALETARRPVEGSFDQSTDPELPKFKTHQEKYEELARQLDEVRQKFGGSEAAKTATLYYGDAQFQLGQFDKAIESYEAFLKNPTGGNATKVLALEGLGYAYEAKKDYAKASEAFGRMKSEAGEGFKDRAAYHQARLLELQGKKEEAAAAYQQIKVDFKDSPTTRAAIDRLSLLASQGVPLPPEPKAEKPNDSK
ncbi:MAG: tetratricopeptide repeat protein [Myxococcales bacterium]